MIIFADILRITLPSIGRAVECLDPGTRGPYQAAFLPILAAAGASMILLDILDPTIMQVVGSSQCITDAAVFSWR
jgi:F420-dependent methylenetetrahydromethanopterin dehydrogenase